VLARHVPWAESGILDGGSLLSDFVLLCVGCTVAELWMVKPWFVLPALAPVGLLYQSLMVPRLKREAETDAKTGLYNARHFAALFAAELERAHRFDRPLAVIMADLDHLREINNTYGHLAGDTVLTGVAGIIQATVRDYDIAARFGGEEFALILPEVEEEQALELAERLRRAIEGARFSVSPAADDLGVTMSLGVACYPHDGRTTTELLHIADTAVYAAKSSGRNRVICASEVPAAESQAAALERPVPGETAMPAERIERAEPAIWEATPPSPTVERMAPSWAQTSFVITVAAAGLGLLFMSALNGRGTSAVAIVLFTVLGGLAEVLEVDLSGQGTVSVSVGIAFTAALLAGIPGLACVSGVIALVHHTRQRRGFSQLHRALFNWSVHILGGSIAVGALGLLALPLNARDLDILVPVAVLAALGYFVVETGLVAMAITLARDHGDALSGWKMWRANYQWLMPHYIVLCLSGLALSVAFTALGVVGVLIFAVPLLMLHYVQRQYVVQSRENVRALQRLNRDLLRTALHDHLTGLGNERGFQEALRREVRAAAERGTPLSLARVNIDDFRAINEEQGRQRGDSILVAIGGVLAAAPALHHAFRLGADDFAVILPNTPLSEGMALSDRLRAETPSLLAGATISCGLAAIHPGEADADLLNQQACEALGEAKRRGRDVVISFEEIRESTLVASWAQAQAVRRLLAEQQVEVAFQPIWDIDRGTILGYEALARPGTEYGLVGPQDAFDVATRIGRARELDAVCRAAILARAGELPAGTLLFMNVAPESLERDGLPAPELVQAVRRAGLGPEQVVLELTERSIIRPDTVVRQAQLLRTHGFKFALDDTGAGNAGLGVLSQLKVDFVKIDRGVIYHAGTDQSARAVVAGIFALAREMGAYVIAEGIETVEMLEMIQHMSRETGPWARGGRGVQGYLLGVPSISVGGDESDGTRLPAARLRRGSAGEPSRLTVSPEPIAVGW
ncbi:MAG TPA: bifunctional diguanylate cyclase/phosphodiesterase, partial [Chloroflexota bacterium]|nr:bifunctional diguanylate cyclase/phosphodiesterase [Chloroflexota bacterium]